MSDVYEYTKAKNNYVKLRNTINDIVAKLDSAIANLDDSSKSVAANYIIDNESADYGKILRIKEDLCQKKADLQNFVLPKINYNIQNYSKLINEINNN